MKTKHVLRTVLFMMTMVMASPSMAAVGTPVRDTNPSEQRATELKNRLEEIRAMDMNKLSRNEKKKLRGEVKEIKKEIKAISGGVYLSVGAIILIVLLIILLA
jgi:hypothetical protein